MFRQRFFASIVAIALLIAVLSRLLYTQFFPAPIVTTALSDFKVPFVFGRFTLPPQNPLTVEAVTLGRFLFYDARLSSNNQVSCATCHKQKLAFTDGKKTSVGVSNTPLTFNAMSLANLLWGPQRFFWDGRSLSLEEQALLPIAHADEMGQSIESVVAELSTIPMYTTLFAKAYGDISGDNIARALASFQRTLVSANSKYDRYLKGEQQLTDLEERGKKTVHGAP